MGESERPEHSHESVDDCRRLVDVDWLVSGDSDEVRQDLDVLQHVQPES